MATENRLPPPISIHSKERLRELQSMNLSEKIDTSISRLIEWYQYWGGACYVGFSGGKDSTVCADLAAKVCEILNYKLVLWFSDTGLEFPELKKHVKSFAEYLRNKYCIEVELIIDHPHDKKGNLISFRNVLKNEGYPIVSKQVAEYANRIQKHGTINTRTGEKTQAAKAFDGELLMNNGKPSRFNCQNWRCLLDADFKISQKCCDIMKKRPAHMFEEKTGLKCILGVMAEESTHRYNNWLKEGCNAYERDNPQSKPMSFWLENDVLRYIKERELPICSIYGEIKKDENDRYYCTGYDRSGCLYCGFGAQLQKSPNRYERLKETHPQLYDYCMKPLEDGGLGFDKVLTFINVKH